MSYNRGKNYTKKKSINPYSNFMEGLKQKDFVKNLVKNGKTNEIKNFMGGLKGFFGDTIIPIKSSKERITNKGNIRIYDCGDLIIRTDIKELKEELDKKLLNEGLPPLLGKLQDKYPVPIVIGGYWKKDNWNVYQHELDTLSYGDRGRYEEENSDKTQKDMEFIRS